MEYKYFKTEEFDSPDLPGSGQLMQEDFMYKLDKAREIAGIGFKINSGMRTVSHNAKVGKVLFSTKSALKIDVDY